MDNPTTDPRTVVEIIQRASSPTYETWWSQVAHAGYCAAPVHLSGRDAQGRAVTILTRCKNRRATVCPSCSALYSGDTWQLVHQGLNPNTDSTGPSVPMVFATLTAPSFGPVHTNTRDHRACRPGTAVQCRHGRSVRCTLVHKSDDVRLGEPLCPDCYGYQGHVLFSWHAPQLWHRFTVALRRLVKRHTQATRVSYVKVVELQRRGVPHFHTVIRLDPDKPEESQATLGAGELVALVHQAAATVRLEVPGYGGELHTLRFGTQTDVQPLRINEADDRRIASYLAKYVTKSVAEFGLSSRRISPQAVATLDLRPHIHEILHTVLVLSENPGPSEMNRWLHTLGYRGHITTKTRAYSTTMGALRAQRAAWRARSGGDREDAPIAWIADGSGLASNGERLLATSAARNALEQQRTAREVLRDHPDELS